MNSGFEHFSCVLTSYPLFSFCFPAFQVRKKAHTDDSTCVILEQKVALHYFLIAPRQLQTKVHLHPKELFSFPFAFVYRKKTSTEGLFVFLPELFDQPQLAFRRFHHSETMQG